MFLGLSSTRLKSGGIWRILLQREHLLLILNYCSPLRNPGRDRFVRLFGRLHTLPHPAVTNIPCRVGGRTFKEHHAPH